MFSFKRKNQQEVITDKERIDTILNRGVIVEILPSKESFREKLLRGERVRMYIGADPTATTLHLSHAKNYILLEEFRQLGHEVIVLFGDFTARIGDPSEHSTTRGQLSENEVKQNVSSWIDQIRPLMNFSDSHNPPRVLYNSQWLSRLPFDEVLQLASNFTVQHMLERDMFEKRMRKGEPVHLHEFLYPVMQGYDSVAMNVDVELCGTDQIFNALAGRTLLKRFKEKEKFVVAVHLLEDPSTGQLMSKSQGTGVFLNTTPEEMFGAVMAQTDAMVKPLLINLTRLPLSEIENIMKQHPRDAKQRTAREMVKLFHGEKRAQEAETQFVKTFQKGEVPEATERVAAAKGEALAEVLLKHGVIQSKTEFRRLVEEGAVRDAATGQKIEDTAFTLSEGMTAKVGKRRFIDINVS